MVAKEHNSSIVSGFPGVGKSYLFENHREDWIILDSDSSKFDKNFFPNNYIEHIKANLDTANIICVSSHKIVRDALVQHGLKFNLFFPHRDLKEEYIQRFKNRGSPDAFIKLLDTNWDIWMDELEVQEGCQRITLLSGEYLSDVIYDLL